MNTNNHEYGVGKNRADGIAKVGRKTQMLEKQIEAQVAQEMIEIDNAEKRRNEERYFDTQSGEAFTK